jgi:formamidopyrimidine-DNA glycosylase
MVGDRASLFERSLRGVSIERIDRQGKWMFFRLSADRTLVIHLGMTGHLSVDPAPASIEPHTHFRLLLEPGNEELRFIDPRRFGELLLLCPTEMAGRFGPDKLGPDALEVSAEHMGAELSRTKRTIKSVLLDQRVVAGIGNIYADEILFATGIHPAARADRLSGDGVDRLVSATRQVLRAAIRAGGSTIRDYVDATGRPGEFQNRHFVYGREGEPCRRCPEKIRLDRTVVSGRSTHFCPGCQTFGGRHRTTRPRPARAIK